LALAIPGCGWDFCHHYPYDAFCRYRLSSSPAANAVRASLPFTPAFFRSVLFHSRCSRVLCSYLVLLSPASVLVTRPERACGSGGWRWAVGSDLARWALAQLCWRNDGRGRQLL
jgi:hypothetical protein